MLQSVIQRAFAGGELAPALYARADVAKYVTGLRTCRNFVVRREGGVSFRGGLRFIGSVKSSALDVQLFPYFSDIDGESLLVENGEGYFRFWKNGALVTLAAPPAAWSNVVNYVIGDLVLSVGINYYCRKANINKIPASNPTEWYAMPAGDIFEIPCPFGTALPYWHQSGRVITLTHEDYKPAELIFYGLTAWVIQQVTTAPSIAGPTGLNGTAGAAGTRTFGYIVTAVAEDTYEESLAGSLAQVPNAAAPTPEAPIVVDWSAVAGAVEYRIYADPFENGSFGYIGTASSNSFRDTGFIPDFTTSEPLPRVLFNATGKYPRISASYQQRRFFANSKNEPDSIWASKVGFPSNFSISSPLQDDDALTFRLAGVQHHPVRHLFGLRQLVALTDGGAWTIGEPKTPLSPSEIPADQDTYLGISPVRPVVIGNRVIYLHGRGRTVLDLRFDQQVEGLGGRDLTIFAAHLFEHYNLVRLAYQHVPDSVVWAVRSDGTLLGLTYVPEQEVWGWHRHDTRQEGTSGYFEDVAVVPEPGEDATYVLVRRTIGGNTKRYIERLSLRSIVPGDFNGSAFFVDSGLTYDGSPATNFTGLDHLEGEVVAVLADGEVVYDGDPDGDEAESYRVAGGAINIPTAASEVHIGLRYVGEIETLDLDVAGAEVRDRRKRVAGLTVILEDSGRSWYAGPDGTALRQMLRQPFEPTDRGFTGQATVHLTSHFTNEGRIVIKQYDPLPLNILGILPLVELGG